MAQTTTTNEPSPLEGSAEKLTQNRLTQLNGIRWRYDVHGRTVEKDNGQTRWHYRYDGEHRLTEVISQPRDRNRPQTEVSFRYDPLGRRISKTRRQMLGGQPTGRPVTTRFVWEGFRLLQEVHGDEPLTYVYSDQDSYDPLARIDGVDAPEIFWFHCQPNGTPERMTDSEGQVRWEGVNSAWGKLLRESETQVSGYSQNLRMQGQYLDRETGLHYNLFRYYDPDCGRFTQQDQIGLAGGIKLYQYAPNALGWVDPWGLALKGVDFTGSPDLFPINGTKQNIVSITMQGTRDRDFTKAFKAAGISKNEAIGYTWHHVDDFDPATGRTTMQLVKTSAHEAIFPHKGSVSQFEKYFGVKYGSQEAIAVSHSKGWLKGCVPKKLRANCHH